MLMSLTLENPISLAISLIIILIFISDIRAGYKKGFLQTAIKFLISLIAMVLAYFLKTPLSSFLYLNFPFFELGGIFKGVTSINILIYEIISFFVLYVLIMIILSIINGILKLDEKLIRFVAIIGVPNRIAGALFGALKSIIFLYFGLSLLFVGTNFTKIDVGTSLGDYIVDFPLLKNTFGSVVDSFDEITELAVEYENIQDKEELNEDAINILLEYDVITEENLELLIESGKINYSLDNAEEQKETMEDLNEAFNKWWRI